MKRLILIAFALIINAGIYGIKNQLDMPPFIDSNLFKANLELMEKLQKLPDSLDEARQLALKSNFICEHVPEAVLNIYCDK